MRLHKQRASGLLWGRAVTPRIGITSLQSSSVLVGRSSTWHSSSRNQVLAYHSSASQCESKLDKIMRTELLQGETSEKIGSIWVDYHKGKECVSASIKSSVYDLLKQRFKQCPRFLIPLPREPSGFLMILLEAKPEEDVLLMGKLEDYQKYGSMEAMTPILTLQYYTELSETKGLVLMRGDVLPDAITTTEAQCLVNQLQLFYLGEEKYQVVKDFNYNPASFNYEDLLKDLK